MQCLDGAGHHVYMGLVDRRERMTLKVLDLFAGAGGFTLAGEMAGGYDRMIHGC